jgi:WD40 repeat protein/serine/threonine protein kinase
MAGCARRISHGSMKAHTMSADKQNASNREREIFLQALERETPSERAAFLDGACGRDTELRAAVEALLAHHRPDSFLEEPAVGAGQTVQLDSVMAAPVTEQPGDRIGRYKLLQKIGEGGMGVVYMAEQEEPVRRRVALKIIKLGMDTKQVVARFEAERQALALMDHPNIAKVLDAGSTETGRPYFVMELVKGIKITGYCDQHNLPLRPRLELFTKVCQAIQHAHQKGIIHRDIKPSNILVTLHDGVPIPKVIDFGIAKATEQKLTEKTLFTQFEALIGTPSYMSPEQAEMSGLDIDTRTDIYALGVLLYQMLTGRTPFDGQQLLAAGLDEMRRTIREKEPARPSTRVSTMLAADLNEVAKHRQTEGAKLASSLRGDLDWIVMKCLEKDRTRRYETSIALAQDIGRHLNLEPVLARPPSQLYRFHKLVRRNKLAVAAVAAILATLVLGVITSTWQWRNSEGHRHLAERNAAKAQATVTRLEIDRAEMLFASDQSAEALAYLARVLRREPTNLVAGERIISGLAHRNFCVPLFRLEHKGTVTAAGFSPDGQRVLTVSKNGGAQIWDGHTGQPLLGPFPHTDEVTSAAFSPDGARLVTTSLDKTARIWDARTGEPVTAPLQHEAGVLCADFSSDGRRLATGSADGSMRLWTVTTGAPLGTQMTIGESVDFVKFSGDGKRIVLASRQGPGRLLNAADGTELAAFTMPSALPDMEFAFPTLSGDGTRVVVKRDGTILRSICTTSFTNLVTGRLHENAITCIRFSPDGQTLATSAVDSTAKLWDAATFQQVAGMRHGNWVNSIEFSPDGSQIVTGAKDHTARIWDSLSGRPLSEPLPHDANVLSVQFSPDAQRILSRCEGSRVWVWEVRRGQPFTISLPHPTVLRKAVFSPDGSRAATTCWTLEAYSGTVQDSGQVHLWDARQGIPLLSPLGPGIFDAQFSRDGRRLLALDYGGTATVWDTDTGKIIGPPIRDTNDWREAQTARLSPDGQLLALGGFGHRVPVWRIATGSLVWEFPHNGKAAFAQFSPNGQWVVTTSEDKTARLWDLSTGQPMTEPLRHDGAVVWADVSADSRRVVTVSKDKTARIWEAPSGKLLHTLPHASEPHFWNSVQFSSDGRLVAIAAGSTAQIWNSRTGQPTTAPLKHDGRVNSVQFSPDGKRLLTASHDFTARIWDVASGHLLSEPLSHRDRVNYAEFSQDGRWVITASYDRTARIWEVPALASPAPAWLADWAEALVGQRLDVQNAAQSVPFEEVSRLRERLEQASDGDESSRWAKWFFAQNATRTISPGSPLTVAQLAQQRTDHGTLEALQQAVRLSPTNAMAQARLAWLTLTNATAPSRQQMASADWQSRQAVALAPDDSRVWWARSQVCERLGKLDEALQAAERAITLNSSNALFWNAFGLMLGKSNRLDDALKAFSRAISLSGPWKDTLSLPATAHLNRVEVLQRLERWGEAGIDNAAAYNIPQREPGTPPNLINLSSFYNRSLNAVLPGGSADYTFARLPRGRQSLKDTEFDLRGVIELAAADKTYLPERVNAIQVKQKARRLCFLHACGSSTADSVKPEAEGTKMAAYVINYADGAHEEIPIIYGQHLRVYNSRKDSSKQLAQHSALEWKETNMVQYPIQLFKSTWENPSLDKRIETIDLISTVGEFRPVLFAITAEP